MQFTVRRPVALALLRAVLTLACITACAGRSPHAVLRPSAQTCPVAPTPPRTSRAERVLEQRRALPLAAVAFSPDGRSLAALSDTGRVSVWNLHDHSLLAVHDAALTEGGAENAALRWIDERRIVSHASLWPVRTLDVRTGTGSSWAPDGSVLLLPSAGADTPPRWITLARGQFLLHDASGAVQGTLPGLPPDATDTPTLLGASASGDTLALLTPRGMLRWHIDQGLLHTPDPLPSPDLANATRVDLFPTVSAEGGFSYSVPQQLVLGAHGATQIVLRDANAVVQREGRAPLVLRGPRGDLQRRWDALVLAPDEQRLLAFSDVAVSLIDLSRNTLVWTRELLGGARGGGEMRTCACYRSGAFSPDGTSVAMGTGDGRVLVYDAAQGRLLARLSHGEAPWEVRDLIFGTRDVIHTLAHAPSPTNAYDYGTTPRGLRGAYSLSAWNLDDLSVRQRIDQDTQRLLRVDGAVATLQLREDAACVGGAAVTLSSLSAGPARRVGCLLEGETLLDVDPQRGMALLTGQHETYTGLQVLLADLRSGQRTSLPSVYREVAGAQHSDDGRWMFAWWIDHGVDIPTLIDVRARSSQPLPREAFPEEVGPVSLAPDGTRLATSGGHEIRVLALPAFAPMATYHTPAEVRSLLMRDGGVVAGLADGRLFVADSNGARVSSEHGPGALELLRLAPDGLRVASVAPDGSVILWNASAPALLATLSEFAPEDWLLATPDGYYAGTPEAARRVGWVFQSPFERFDFDRFAALDRVAARVRARLAGAERASARERPRPPAVSIEGHVSRDESAEITARVASRSGRVDRVRAFVEGRPVADVMVCQPEAVVRVSVPLASGRTRATLIAFDQEGVASNPAEIDLEGPAGVARPDVWVVAVGISRYPHLPEEMQLNAADDDARSVAEAFTALSGPGRPFGSAHATVLQDEAATPAAVLQALSGLGAMRPNDLAVVLLAGHGIRPTDDGEMVFLTSGVRGPTALEGAFVGWTPMAQALGRASGRVLVLLDACHSGHFQRENVIANEALAATLSAEGRTGIVVFSASRGAEESLERGTSRGLRLVSNPAPDDEARPQAPARAEEPPHGVFTAAVLRTLAEDETDADGDGVVRFSELAARVIERVGVDTEGAQTPWITRREIFGDFAVVQRGASVR